MKPIFLILVFSANMVFRDGSAVASLFLAIILTVALSIFLEIKSRAKRQSRRARAKSAPPIADGDIGPHMKHMLERGKHDAAILCIEEHIPGSWEARRHIIALVDEHGMLQRSIRIARLAGVPMPDEATGFADDQIDMIADRARRMAFVYQHDAMNPRIAASLGRLANGAEPLIAQSTTLRADLAESTGNPQWGKHEEKELLRKLERMSHTLRAMNSDLQSDEIAALAAPEGVAALDPGSSLTTSSRDGWLTPREREVLALLAEGKSNPAIAEALYISQRTVTTHLSRLYAKLDVSTRAEAIAQAMRMGLVSAPTDRT